MGDFSYSNASHDYSKSFYAQLVGFIRQLCKEAKLDWYDLRPENEGEKPSDLRAERDVLLVYKGTPLLSVYLCVQHSLGRALQPDVTVSDDESEFGRRLSAEIKKAEPRATPPVKRCMSCLQWAVLFRGADTAETEFEGDQFDLDKINDAFNALETRLIAEIAAKAATKA